MADAPEYAILVVDDDEPIVKNMRRVLRRKGFNKVISALNAEQAIKLLEDIRNHFFLIMSDQRMPGMAGSEFLEKSILLSPESRRMLITGFSDFDAIVDAVNKGEIHQYIAKPWDNDDLVLRIMEELEIYKQFQDRKRLFKITRHQNAKLFEIAEGSKKNLADFTTRLENKTLEKNSLIQAIKKARDEAEYKEIFPGLDELLSRTITMNQQNLVQAFALSMAELKSAMERIAKKNDIAFFLSDAKKKALGPDAMDDDIFDIIDQIIENVVQAIEPELFGIGSEPSTGMAIDDYKQVPTFDTLAFNDGYITRGEQEKALAELETKEAEQSTGLTIDKVLISMDFLQRKDLSRLFAKLALIETRLLDRQFAEQLIAKKLAGPKDINRAFRKQLNNFEDSGVSTLLGNILVESGIIDSKLCDEIMAAQDRSGKKKGQASAFSSQFGAFVDLQVSEDRVQAWIRLPKTVHGTTDLGPIKSLIKKRGIKHGIVPDQEILEYMKNCTDPLEKFIIAKGIPASVGKPARIVYHFNTKNEAVGLVKEDGSIDFRSRGDSPFVKKGQLLAEKIPMEHPKSGVDIFGETLLVSDVQDIPLEGGNGVEFSDDKMQLFAAIQGQPSLDIKGTVSVLEQFTVKGDVNFKTGNINFSGNVLVTGTVKEGFTIECDDLTADEINGGIILIRGNLKVSNGIVNSYIETQGGVQAKFLNNTKIFAHKDIMITREIMESKILTSGEFKNETGRITASHIAARLGFNVKQIGTQKAEFSTIKSGTDDHIHWIAENYDIKIDKLQKKLDQAIEDKHKLDEEHNLLHVDVANQTFSQEKLTQKMDFLEKAIGKAKTKEEKLQNSKELKEIEAGIALIDQRIKNIFQDQDLVIKKIETFDQIIQDLNSQIADLKQKKQVCVQNLAKQDPVPVVKVSKKIHTGTRIVGTQAFMTVQNDLGMSKFSEIDSDNPDSPKQIVHQTL